MLTKIALAAALVIASVSATLAANTDKSREHARASYAQAHARPSVNADADATGPVQPVTPFERSWFDYQDQGTSD